MANLSMNKWAVVKAPFPYVFPTRGYVVKIRNGRKVATFTIPRNESLGFPETVEDALAAILDTTDDEWMEYEDYAHTLTRDEVDALRKIARQHREGLEHLGLLEN